MCVWQSVRVQVAYMLSVAGLGLRSHPTGTCGNHCTALIRAPTVLSVRAKRGEVWRGEGVETLGKRNVLAEPLWEALLKQA